MQVGFLVRSEANRPLDVSSHREDIRAWSGESFLSVFVFLHIGTRDTASVAVRGRSKRGKTIPEYLTTFTVVSSR